MRLDAYTLTADSIVTLASAPARRAWMDRTPERFANRCLPLMMANQAGWELALTEPVELAWSGGDGLGQVAVFGSDRVKESVASHFGSGIVTFKLPYLFRTEPGYNLLARGPANLPKDGLAPLEGLIETDWSFAPFTMNWQVTRPGKRLRFETGEAICLLTPVRRDELAAFAPRLRAVDEDPEVAAAYRAWRAGRATFLRDLSAREDAAVKAGWQRDYFLGRGPGDQEAPAHQTKHDPCGDSREERSEAGQCSRNRYVKVTAWWKSLTVLPKRAPCMIASSNCRLSPAFRIRGDHSGPTAYPSAYALEALPPLY